MDEDRVPSVGGSIPGLAGLVDRHTENTRGWVDKGCEVSGGLSGRWVQQSQAARLLAEDGTQADGWRSLLGQVSAADVHGSWRRGVLLALARSERAHGLLDRHIADLVANDGAMLGELDAMGYFSWKD